MQSHQSTVHSPVNYNINSAAFPHMEKDYDSTEGANEIINIKNLIKPTTDEQSSQSICTESVNIKEISGNWFEKNHAWHCAC
jgi:hypothetical protein